MVVIVCADARNADGLILIVVLLLFQHGVLLEAR